MTVWAKCLLILCIPLDQRTFFILSAWGKCLCVTRSGDNRRVLVSQSTHESFGPTSQTSIRLLAGVWMRRRPYLLYSRNAFSVTHRTKGGMFCSHPRAGLRPSRERSAAAKPRNARLWSWYLAGVTFLLYLVLPTRAGHQKKHNWRQEKQPETDYSNLHVHISIYLSIPGTKATHCTYM